MYGAMAQSTNMNQPLWGYSWGYDIIIIISCHITNIIYIYICVCMSNSGGLTNQFISIWLVKMMRKPILRQTHWGSIYYTSSTAQGGGGSFKNRKPIGEVGCCESGMAERSHWWIERWLRSPLFLSLSLTIYLPIYLSIHLSIYLCIYLSIDLSLSLSLSSI